MLLEASEKIIVSHKCFPHADHYLAILNKFRMFEGNHVALSFFVTSWCVFGMLPVAGLREFQILNLYHGYIGCTNPFTVYVSGLLSVRQINRESFHKLDFQPELIPIREG